MTKEKHELTTLALIDRYPASELGKPQWSPMDKTTYLEIKKVMQKMQSLESSDKMSSQRTTDYVPSLPVGTHHCCADHQPAPEPRLSKTKYSAIALATALDPRTPLGAGAIHTTAENPYGIGDQFQHLQPNHRFHRNQPCLDLAGFRANAQVPNPAKQPPDFERHTLHSL